MSIRINIKKNLNENKIKNYVLFTDENFRIKGLEKLLLKKYSSLINKSIINNMIKDKNFYRYYNLSPHQDKFVNLLFLFHLAFLIHTLED